MLNFIKSLLERPSSNTSGVRKQKEFVREPRELSEEYLNYGWAQLEMLKSGRPEPIIDPANMVPILAKVCFQNGEFFGPPLNSHSLFLKDLIPCLEVNREQSLWLSVIKGINYSSNSLHFIVEWILDQPDCDALIAAVVFSFFDGPVLCGTSTEDKYAMRSEGLPLLKRINEREKAGKHYVVELACDRSSRHEKTPEELLEMARHNRSKLKDGEQAVIEIPEVTLLAAGRGTKPIEEYEVDEVGITVLERGQEAIFE